MSASGFFSSRPPMKMPRKPRTSLPTRAKSAIVLSGVSGIFAILHHKPRQLIDPRLDLFGRKRAIAIGKKARVGAFLDRDHIHVFKFSSVSARPDIVQNRSQHIFQWRPRLR